MNQVLISSVTRRAGRSRHTADAPRLGIRQSCVSCFAEANIGRQSFPALFVSNMAIFDFDANGVWALYPGWRALAS